MLFDLTNAGPAYKKFHRALWIATGVDYALFTGWRRTHSQEIAAQFETVTAEAATAWLQLRYEQDVGFLLDSSLPNPEQESRA